MKLTSTAPASSASRRLSRAAAIVATEMGHRQLGRRPVAAVGAAVRARRAVDRLLDPRRMARLGKGGS
jgi:hypothetical protein